MPPADNIKLSCEGLWKVYGDNPGQHFTGEFGSFDVGRTFQQLRDDGYIVACGDVKIDIPAGSIFIIMGLSGSGKSTVLRCLSRLVEPTFGKVILDGLDLLDQGPKEMIEIRRHKMGMVFQNFGLLPHLDVLKNVAFPLKAQGISKNERLGRAKEMIDLVGLEGRETSYPHQLSGGQQQRVGIARSLAAEPEVWFLDEPFSALDPLIRTQMQDEFLRLQTQLHKTIVFVTHDFLEALRLADHICIMKDGQVVQIGTPSEIVLAPANDYVEKFTGEVPLWKIIEAHSIMDPPDGKVGDRPSVKPEALLEEVMQLFEGDTEEVEIVNDAGECCGVLTPVSIIRALYRDEK